jgi:hypothetical protein
VLSDSGSEFPSPSSKKSKEELGELRKLIDKLDDIKKDLRENGDNHDEVIDEAVSYISRLLIVRCCGYLEFILSEASKVYSVRSAYNLVGYISYLEKRHKGAKADIPRIVDILENLLNSSLDSLTKNQLREKKSAIDSMIKIRNLVSHGQSEGSTRRSAISYYDTTIIVSEIIERVLNTKNKTT